MTPFSSGLRSSSSFLRDNLDSNFIGIEVRSEGRNDTPSSSSIRKKARRASHPILRMFFSPSNSHIAHLLCIIVPLLFFSVLVLLFFDLLPSMDLSAPSSSFSNRIKQNPNFIRYPYSKIDNLIMVAGHSVYTSPKCASASNNDAWYLESYQRLPDQAKTFVEHIRVGVEKAAQDPSSLLLFSGGQTRKSAGPRTEAQSYWIVAEAANWFGSPSVAFRSLTEEFARDSFENLLFSICRFRELTGKYPENITVISYDFKETRFKNLHRGALHFPTHRFFYLGTPYAKEGQESAINAEKQTVASFEFDPYGCFSSLEKKRRLRDPFFRHIPYPAGCPEIASLFTYCGRRFYNGKLPWLK